MKNLGEVFQEQSVHQYERSIWVFLKAIWVVHWGVSLSAPSTILCNRLASQSECFKSILHSEAVSFSKGRQLTYPGLKLATRRPPEWEAITGSVFLTTDVSMINQHIGNRSIEWSNMMSSFSTHIVVCINAESFHGQKVQKEMQCEPKITIISHQE